MSVRVRIVSVKETRKDMRMSREILAQLQAVAELSAFKIIDLLNVPVGESGEQKRSLVNYSLFLQSGETL